MHALEKRALSDPFLADALEGALSVTPQHFADDLKDIHSQLRAKKKFTVVWRIAAAVALLAAASYVVYLVSIPVHNESIAKVQEALPPTVSSDSINLAPAPKEQEQPVPESKPTAPSKTGASVAKVKPAKEEPIAAVTIEPASTSSAGASQQSPVEEVVHQPPTVVAEQEEQVVAKTEADDAKVERLDKAEKKIAARQLSMENPEMDIKGRITASEDGSPIAGANITLPGTSKGVLTDEHGYFRLKATSIDVLNVSSMGFGTVTISIEPGQNQLKVELPPDGTKPMETEVVNYKRDIDSVDYDEPLQLAHPVTGVKAYNKYLETALRYPADAIAAKIEGKVTVEFQIGRDGSVNNFKVIRGLSPSCNDEVIRLVKEGAAWRPSFQNRSAVESTARVRVRFKLPK